jgi:hypothetical protein
MIVSLFVVPGVAILLVSALAGVVTHYGRKSPELLVAPPQAGFGAASRLVRAEATRERARADLASLTTPKTAPALTLVPNRTDQAGSVGPKAARPAA